VRVKGEARRKPGGTHPEYRIQKVRAQRGFGSAEERREHIRKGGNPKEKGETLQEGERGYEENPWGQESKFSRTGGAT